MFQGNAFQHDAFQIGESGAQEVALPNALMMMGQGLALALFNQELIREAFEIVAGL